MLLPNNRMLMTRTTKASSGDKDTTTSPIIEAQKIAATTTNVQDVSMEQSVGARRRSPAIRGVARRGNQTSCPHLGQGASHVGCDGSMRISPPQQGQRNGSPSGVREEMVMIGHAGNYDASSNPFRGAGKLLQVV